MQSIRNPIQRAIALLLAAVMAIGLLPTFTVDAWAADAPASITFTYAAYDGATKRYYSTQLKSNCDFHMFRFKVNGAETVAFCNNHNGYLGKSIVGQPWKNPKAYTSDVTKLMDWYYTKLYKSIELDSQYPADKDNYAKQVDRYSGYMTQAMREWNNAWIQSCVWLSKAGKLPTLAADRDGFLTMCATEMKTVLTKFYSGTEPATMDHKAYLETVLDYPDDALTHYDYFEYSYAGTSVGKTVQSIIVPVAETPPPDPDQYSVYITFDKVDGDGKPLAGATFNIWDETYEHFFASYKTDGTAGKVYGPIKLPEETKKTNLVLVEASAPEGYKKSDKSYTLAVDADIHTQDNPAKLGEQIPNIPPPTGGGGDPEGVLRKIDAATNMGVGPATFNFKGQAEDGTAVDADFRCDETGSLELQWTDASAEKYIKPGQYTVTEKIPPQGYTKTEEEYHLVLSVDALGNGVHSGPITFANNKLHKVIIKKVDDNGAPLPGAKFEIYHNDRYITTVTTEHDGTFTYAGDAGQGVDDGWYRIVEIEAPSGYQIPFIHSASIFVDSSDLNATEHIVNFTNSTYPEILIQKVDKETGEPLANATFDITIDGKNFGRLTTGIDGTIVINHATYGKFLDMDKQSWTVQVSEVKAPELYNRDKVDTAGWTQTFELQNGQTFATFTFEDTHYRDIKVAKRDKDTGELLAGATFRLHCISLEDGVAGNVVDRELTTDETGFVVFENVPNGVYEVTEVQPPQNYEGTTKVERIVVTSDSERVLEFTFENTHYRDIKVTKRDAETDWLLAGATFRLHCISVEGGGGKIVDRELTTDATGFVVFENVPNGVYELSETQAPYGYVGTDEVKRVVVSGNSEQVIEFVYKNTPKSGLLIRKVDAVTKQPIRGVEFRITPLAPLNTPSWTAITDDNGVIVRENLPAGSYKIEEITTVDGYVLNTASQIVEIDAQHDSYTVTFENTQKNMLNILKLDGVTGQPLAGAIFSIRTAGGTHIANVTTGINGYATLPNLKPGSYVVQEIQAPPGHIIDTMPQTFEVLEDDSGRIYTLVFQNSPHTNLYIRKYDALTGIGLEGAHFKVWKDNTLIADDVASDAQGFIHIGKQTEGMFQIQEIKAPAGYILNDKIFTIYLQDGETGTIEIPNKKPGGVAVRKIDAETGAALAGAKFELRRLNGELIGAQTTGDDGYARWGNIEPGYYVLEETEAPKGYVKSIQTRNVEVKEFQSTEIEWKNSQNASLTIIKRDKETDVPLANATFEIRTMRGELVTTLTTDTSGSVTSSRLTPGWYRILETKAPAGYLLNKEEKIVEITADTPVVLDFYNTPEKGITIHKVDGITLQPLAGAVIEVRTVGNKLIGSYTSDAGGTIVTRAMEPGYYYLVETKAPDGYVLSEEKILVQVEEGAQTVETVKNYPKTSIQVYKTDSATGDPLSGAEFEVRRADGTTVEFITTDKTGWAYTTTLPAGEYYLVETKAPSGYQIDATPHRVTLTTGNNAILRLTNTAGTSLHITKVDSVTRKPLAGAEFEIRYDTGHGDCTYIGTYTTDTLGMIHTQPLTPGFYMIKETKAPVGYAIVQEEYRFCVKEGEYNQLIVENQALATLIVRKIDSKTGKPIAGAVFKLENADTSDLVGTLETDAQGEAIWTGLTEGFYIVTETQAPSNYTKEPCSKTIKVEYGKNNYVDFKDDENGSLVIVLQDKYTNEYLYGGEFRVTRESDQIVVFDGSTDTTGTIVVGYLLPGWYTVEQTFPPDEYTMIDVRTKVEILVGQQQTVYFKDATAGLVIEKVDAQHPAMLLEGARFQVKRDTDGIVIGEYVTGKDGLAIVGGLVPGLYTVTELAAPLGYALDSAPKTVHVKEGTTAHATFLDTALSSITIKVVDTATKQPIVGAIVEVWEQNGVLVNTYTTDTTGVIQTDKLPAGHYVLKLTYVPDGFSLGGAALSGSTGSEATVELKDGIETTYQFELTAKSGLKIMSVDGEDKALSGMRVMVTTLDGARVGEYTTGKDGSVIVSDLNPGWYVVTETKAPNGAEMSDTPEQRVEIKSGTSSTLTFRHGAVYGLQIVTTSRQTQEKVAGAVYEIRQMNGAIVGKYTSDNAGLISVSLQSGWYTVQPISAPAGYTIPDTTPRNVEITADKLTQTEFLLDQMSSIRVRVVDGNTRKAIYNVRLQLKGNDGTIKEYYTNNEGYVVIDKSVLNGEYTLEMISAPDGYIVDKIPKTINTLVAETTEITWGIYKEGGQIQVLVTSKDENMTTFAPAGTRLQGAVFEITNADTYQVVGQMISDAQGMASSSALPVGRYTLRMVSAPAYYAVDTAWNPELRIKLNNDVVQTTCELWSVNLGTEITLQSNNTIRPGSTMRVDVKSAKNTSDVSLDNFYVHIKIPTDGARITTFSTGSWNKAVFYKVSYKTNMNDYRILAQNLLSTNVYQYGLSTQALQLQSGEYVTDIRMEYGTVPVGFATVKQPAWMQYVLSTATIGHKLIMRAEIGGQHNTVNVGTNHINNDFSYSTSGSAVIDGAGNAGSYGGSGTAAVTGNSGQWTTNTSQWTTTVASPVGSSTTTTTTKKTTTSSSLPSTLPKTGY